MSFIETPSFPDSIARGATRTLRTRTEIVTGQSGVEQRNALARYRTRSYEVRLPPRASATWADWANFVESLRGPADGFRMKDFADYEATHTNGKLHPYVSGALGGTIGYGYGVPTFQLAKVYTAWATAYPRRILKPISSGLTIKRGGVTCTAGVAAGNYALSTTTGVVTFVADQSKAINTHTVGASHKFTLATAFSPNIAVGGRLYVTGVTGTAATLLNSLPLEVTNVSTTEITVAVTTTGLTASSGTAYFYPQPTEALTWAGNFDVPVRFDSDELVDVIVHRTASGDVIMEAPAIGLVELLNP